MIELYFSTRVDEAIKIFIRAYHACVGGYCSRFLRYFSISMIHSGMVTTTDAHTHLRASGNSETLL